MSGRISNLFTSLTGNTTHARETAAMYVDHASIHELFELIKQLGQFSLKQTKGGFEVGLGKYIFTIEDFMDLLALTMQNVESLSREDADICAKLGNILLPHNDKPVQLQASDLDDERRLWVAVNRYMNRKVRAFNQDQRIRFDFLHQKYSEKFALGLSTNKAEHDANAPHKTVNPSLGSAMGGFLQTDQLGRGQASIYVENDAIGFLIQLAIEYGELNMSFNSSEFMLSLNGIILAFDFRNDFGKLRLLSTLTMGSAEILLKTIRFMHDDFQYDASQEIEFEAVDETAETLILEQNEKINSNEKFRFRGRNHEQKQRFEQFRHFIQRQENLNKNRRFSFSQAVKDSHNTTKPDNSQNPTNG